ncbi:MAG: hypothetical protein DHS20C13_22190 [Thermodesulfobacteriota bacterium]|nr:MAG: hypothetical protein DHS20C13_22190 [Thermodesulfobacteriota bacterium]GJM35916.1 MAG: hypothetical protein DHS20C18_49170 [Saprospiraceae bacterium]
MTEKNIEEFNKLQPQVKSAYDEISILSKKKPEDAVNKFKLKFINGIIERANNLIGKEFMPFPDDFEAFNVDEMPTNSDVVFIFANYLKSLEKFKRNNIKYSDGNWYWVVNGEKSKIRTSKPMD